MLNHSESLSEKFIKRWIWLYLFSFLIWPLGYIIKIVLSYDLSVEEIWIIYWIISLISLLSVYHDLGLTESLNYFLPKFLVAKDYSRFKSSLIYTLIAQIPTSLIIWWWLFFGSDYLAANYFNDIRASEVLKLMSFFFIWMNLFGIVQTVYWAIQNTKYQKWTEFIRMFAILIFVLVFHFMWKWNLHTYSYNWIFWLAVWIIFSYTLFYFKYYRQYLSWVKIIFEKELAKKIASYAIWVLLAANVGMVMSQIDMQLIIYLLWTKDAWYYTNYLSIIWIPFIIITPIIGFLFPVISELWWKNDYSKIKIIMTMFYKYFAVMWIIVSAFMFIFANEFAVVFFWEKFIKSWEILRYSILFLVFNFLFQINFQILAWIGKIKTRVKILAIWLLVNIPLNLVFIKLLWVNWSSLAVWLSWIPVFILSYIATKEFFGWFDFKFFIKNIFLVFVISLIFYFYAIPFLQWLWRLELLFSIIFIWILYIIPLFLLNVYEFRLFIQELKKLKNPKNI